MDTIKRKTMLYPTKVEYGDYAMNHVQGCAHACRYPCYAFLMKRRFGQLVSMEEWARPALVENTLELLEREIPRLKKKIKHVNMCFTTDPFMNGYPEVTRMSLKAARLLNDAGIKCIFLTKGKIPCKALGGLSPENEYGISLVSLSEEFRRKYEPGSAKISERLERLRRTAEMGLKTWVSMEPYPTPNMFRQDIRPLLDSVDCAERIVFGKVNYSQGAYTGSADRYNEFYKKQVSILKEFCWSNNIEYTIKAGTPGC